MKKLFFLFSLLSLFLLTGCGNKDLSFDEAKDLAMKNSHLISDVLFKADSPIQQDFSFTTTITDEADTSIDLTVSTQSQQDRATNKSKVNITFDTNITTAADPITASGHLIALLTPASLFLNVEQLWIQGKSIDMNTTMLTALLQGVQGQRFKLSLSGEAAMVDGVNTYLSTLAELGEKNTDLFIEKGNQPYQWAFSQFNGKSAYQFTLDETKIQALTQKVIEALNQLNQQALNDFSVTGTTAIPTGTGIDIQLPLFEGNLVMLKNNTVAVVVDNFEIISNGVSLIGSYRYSPEGLVIWIKEKEIWQSLLTINITETKKATYAIDIQLGTTLTITGSTTLNIKKSALNLDFDTTISLNLTTPTFNEYEGILDETPTIITIPLKGNWKYTTITSMDFTEPAQAIDLAEMMSWLMGAGMLWWATYDDPEAIVTTWL